MFQLIIVSGGRSVKFAVNGFQLYEVVVLGILKSTIVLKLINDILFKFIPTATIAYKLLLAAFDDFIVLVVVVCRNECRHLPNLKAWRS